MSAKENKAFVRRFYNEVLNKGNLSVIDELVAANHVDHAAPPGIAQGIEGTRQWFGMMQKAFPDSRVKVDDLLAEGNKVVARVTMEATHKGEFMGIPATGKAVKIEGIDIIRISRGKAAEHWGLFDNLGMLQQLGVVPPPGKPAK